MRRFHIVANWKANFSWNEARAWLDAVGPKIHIADHVTICPPFPFLVSMVMRAKEQGYALRFGTQTISGSPGGAYTGEVSVDQVKDIAELALLGHSERRRYQHETFETLRAQVHQCKRGKLFALVFFQQVSELSKLGSVTDTEVACVYEPASMISTNTPDPHAIQQTIDELDIIAASVQRLLPAQTPRVYYGGSVTKDILPTILAHKEVHGVVVGAASLHPDSFMEIVRGQR